MSPLLRTRDAANIIGFLIDGQRRQTDQRINDGIVVTSNRWRGLRRWRDGANAPHRTQVIAFVAEVANVANIVAVAVVPKAVVIKGSFTGIPGMRTRLG